MRKLFLTSCLTYLTLHFAGGECLFFPYSVEAWRNKDLADSEEEPTDSHIEPKAPLPRRLGLRAIERGGIGYQKGYATFEMLFAPDAVPQRLLPMIDLRAHHLYDDTYALNAGLIGRYITASTCQIWGFNAYYDYRQGHLGNYQQLGFGIEWLCQTMEFRINGHFPFGSRKHEKKCCFNDFIGDFCATFRREEFAFWGFDSEIGGYLAKTNHFFLYAGIGPYYLTGKRDHNIWGVKMRLRPQYRDLFAIELSTSYDHVFKNKYQAEIIVTLPLYRIYKKERLCIPTRQVYQPVHRFEIIPLDHHNDFKANF